MASKSGYFHATGSGALGFKLKFSWSLKSQNRNDNTSTISWTVSLVDGDGSQWVYGDSIYATVNGTKYTIRGTTRDKINLGTIKSGTTVIKHGTDGTKKFSASLKGSIISMADNMSGSGSWTLPTIARANTITYFNAEPVNGGTYSIKMKKPTSITTTSLRYQLYVNGAWTNEDDGVIISSWDSKNSCYYWDMRGAMAQKVENKLNGASSAKVRLTAITKENSKEIGRSSVERTLKSGRATCSVNNTTIGNKTTVTVNKPSRQSLTLKVYYTFGSDGATLEEYTKTDNDYTKTISWIPKDELHKQFSDAEGVGYLYVRTYSDGYDLGTRSHKFTLYANPDKKPSISITAKDIQQSTLALTGDNQTIIKGVSNVQVDFSASVDSPAKIVDKKVWNNSKYQTTSPATFVNVITPNYEVYAKDSRGFENSKRVTLNMIDYVFPSCNISVDRIDASGNTTIHLKGNCFKGSFGLVDNIITLQYIIHCGDAIVTDWTTVSPKFNGNTYSIDIPIEKLDYRKTYKFQGYIEDKLAKKYSPTVTAKSLPVFDWSETDFNFNVPVSIPEGGLEVKRIDLQETVGDYIGDYTDYVYAIPALRMVWGRFNFHNTVDFKKNSVYRLFTIPTNLHYMPKLLAPMSVYGKYASQAYVGTDGKAYLRCQDNKPTSDTGTYWLSVVWFY